jgi:hypothetical protein
VPKVNAFSNFDTKLSTSPPSIFSGRVSMGHASFENLKIAINLLISSSDSSYAHFGSKNRFLES